MTKAELITNVAHSTGIEKAAIAVIVEEFMTSVKHAMSEGENVYLRGFGTFEVVKRAEKTARDITKATTVIVPAHHVPHFKPAKEFKKMLLED